MENQEQDNDLSDLFALSASAGAALSAAASPAHTSLTMPALIANVARNTVKQGNGKFLLEQAVGVTLASEVLEQIPRYVQLHAALVAGGNDMKHWRTWNNGSMCFVADIDGVPDAFPDLANPEDFVDEMLDRMAAEDADPRGSPSMCVKVMAFRSPPYNYLVIMNRRYGQWSVHLRRYWDRLDDQLACELAQYTDSGIPLEKAIEYAEVLLKYASLPRRPDLKIFTEGNFQAGHKFAGIGLRSQDYGDAGYILSCKQASGEAQSPVRHWTHNALSATDYILDNLKYAASSVLDPDG